jgi:methyl-accepting chemotaxis protein
VQVAVAVGGVLALLAASVLVAVLLVEGIKHDQARLNQRDVPYATGVAAAALSAKAIANDERGFFISSDARFIDEFNRRVEAARAGFSTSANAVVGTAQRQAVQEARTGFERWVATVRGEFAMFRAGDRRGAIAASLGPDRALRKRYEASLARAQALGASAIHSGESSVAAASSRSVVILLACLLIGLAVGCAVAFWVVRTILRPVYAVLKLVSEPGKSSSPA